MLTFASCRLDVEGRLLLKDGRPEPLEPQAFDVLVYLAKNRERVVSKEEILDAVWGDRWVSESALTTRIKEVRRAVGDSGDEQGTIRTVRGRGYQFVASVDSPASELSTLVGRDRDLQALEARLTPSSLITLVGPGVSARPLSADRSHRSCGLGFAMGVSRST
ncbi:MAG: transcriptional regulator [Actinomycetes bacterium]